jgi:two-component system alkaline phosphatase synthesis response regulator PhoP
MKKKHTKNLLVDDEPDILEIVGYNLKQEGYQILLLQMEKKLLQKQKNSQI